ncbi:MAG: glycine cleavage system protein GcvH [Halanaerobiales bacterium]
MEVPRDMFYTENHEWILVEGEEAIVGITEYAQQEMGDVVFVELPEPGDEFEQFDPFGVVESVKAVSDIYVPVGGEITAINEDLFDSPELVNEEPFEGGWSVKLRLSDKDDLETLMDYEDYTRFLEEEE